ncbi:MAG: hypothetical protein K2X99_13335 [Gemmatimonadaceae bacterium]|nr:hypothetical protein [Gemmatimonadaceae bacterium]
MRGGSRTTLAALGAVLSACTSVGADPQAAVAIEFDTLPYPAVVTGDSMRNEVGAATAFAPRAYNVDGARIADATFAYQLLDTGATITPSGVLVARGRRDGSLRVVAQINGIQSLPRTVLVARAPSALLATSTLRDTVKYVLPDIAATNSSQAITLRVATSDSAGGVRGAAGWIVRFRTLFRGQPLGTDSTALAVLVDDAFRTSQSDTTGSDGVVSRRLRIRVGLLPSTADSFVVEATTTDRGRNLTGAPARFVIHYRPRTAP